MPTAMMWDSHPSVNWKNPHCNDLFNFTSQFIAELEERSPIIIQNGSSNPSSWKNLDLWPYGRPYKVLPLTCVVNCAAGTPTPRLCPVVQWSVHWAPSRTPGQGVVPLRRAGKKKKKAPLLGLAKSIYTRQTGSENRQSYQLELMDWYHTKFSWLTLWPSWIDKHPTSLYNITS